MTLGSTENRIRFRTQIVRNRIRFWVVHPQIVYDFVRFHLQSCTILGGAPQNRIRFRTICVRNRIRFSVDPKVIHYEIVRFHNDFMLSRLRPCHGHGTTPQGGGQTGTTWSHYDVMTMSYDICPLPPQSHTWSNLKSYEIIYDLWVSWGSTMSYEIVMTSCEVIHDIGGLPKSCHMKSLWHHVKSYMTLAGSQSHATWNRLKSYMNRIRFWAGSPKIDYDFRRFSAKSSKIVPITNIINLAY